jgi:uncharacterized protein (TIRG00374 family)
VSPVSRRLVLLGAKLVIAAVLIAWLLHSGTLDLGALRLFLDRPELMVANLAVLAFAIVLGGLRWRLLLRLADVRLTVGRALQLHLTALFFNVVIPGNIGGDVLKSVYVARDAAPAKRPTVFLIAFVDRLIGVGSLVVIAFIVVLLRGGEVWAIPGLRELAVIVVVLAALTLLAPIVVLVLVRRTVDRPEEATATRFGRLFGQLVSATRLISAGPGTLLSALGLATLLHLAGMVMFAVLATAVSTHDVSLWSIASVYPLGMLTLFVPISPAGIGVGHVAFERLFAIVGLTGGANVFNLFLIGQTTPCLLGVLPYLTLRRRTTLPTVAEAEAQQAGAGAILR